MEITLEKLEFLLKEQKRLVIERLLQGTCYYNSESTDGHSKSLPIDKDKVTKSGFEASYPNDFEILKSYGIK